MNNKIKYDKNIDYFLSQLIKLDSKSVQGQSKKPHENLDSLESPGK